MRKRGACRTKKSLSSIQTVMSDECTAGGPSSSLMTHHSHFLFERFFHPAHERLVTGGIDEGVPLSVAPFHLLRQVEEASVRAEEDVAGERLERGEGAAVVVGDLRVARVPDQLVLGRYAGAADEDHVVAVSALAHAHGPRGAAARVAGGDVGHQNRAAEGHAIAVAGELVGGDGGEREAIAELRVV